MPCFEKGVPQNEGVEGCATTAVSAERDGADHWTIAENGAGLPVHCPSGT